MIELLQNYLPGSPYLQGGTVVVGGIFLAVVVSFSLNRFISHLHFYAGKSSTSWDDVIIESVHQPVTLLVWLIVFDYAARYLGIIFDKPLPDIVTIVRDLGLIICIFWFAMRFIKLSEKAIASAKKGNANFDEPLLRTMYKFLRIITLIVFALMFLDNLGFSISGLLAFGGIGGIAVGFAAKDLLANFFGGLMIYLDRPFTEGDWIRSPDREIEGTVEMIGWRLTRIRTFERRPIYVPNSIFTQVVVENPSRMESRRLKEIVGVRYDDINRVTAIVEDIKTLLKEHPKIDDNRLLIVALDTFDSSSVNILVYSYIKEIQGASFYSTKQDILLKIAAIVENHNAEIAFPTRTVHVHQENGEKQS